MLREDLHTDKEKLLGVKKGQGRGERGKAFGRPYTYTEYVANNDQYNPLSRRAFEFLIQSQPSLSTISEQCFLPFPVGVKLLPHILQYNGLIVLFSPLRVTTVHTYSDILSPLKNYLKQRDRVHLSSKGYFRGCCRNIRPTLCFLCRLSKERKFKVSNLILRILRG